MANGSVYSVLKLSPLFVRLVSDLISLILKTTVKKVKKPDLFSSEVKGITLGSCQVKNGSVNKADVRKMHSKIYSNHRICCIHELTSVSSAVNVMRKYHNR